MENSLLAIFDKIPCTISVFCQILEQLQKSKNQLKLDTQCRKNIYHYYNNNNNKNNNNDNDNGNTYTDPVLRCFLPEKERGEDCLAISFLDKRIN